ncbi:hypothetical protein GCM10027347_32940 [Larkinella harenae]
MRHLSWLIGILGLAACQPVRQEIAPEQLTGQAAKLVVACFISPQDTVLAARVARSRPLLNDETVTNLEIQNARVTLRTDSRSIELRYHNRLRYYRATPDQFPIRAGETYRLIVQTPEGQRVEARTAVPAGVELQRVRLDSEAVRENGELRKRLFTRYTWTDPPAETNFYQTEGLFTYRCTGCSSGQTAHEPIQFVSAQAGRAIYSDVETNGKAMNSEKGYLGPSIAADQSFFPTVFQKPFSLSASLLHLNGDFYRYHEALSRQQQTDSNPFAEPVSIPTNIQNGLGCFGAYNRSTVSITLK